MSTEQAAKWPWSVLGMSEKGDQRAIKLAYATRLKTMDREDADAFQGLRQARTAALAMSGGAVNQARPNMAQLARSRGGTGVAASNRTTHVPPAAANPKRPPSVVAIDQDENHARVEQAKEPIEKLSENDAPTEQEMINTVWEAYVAAIANWEFSKAAEILTDPILSDRHMRFRAERHAYQDVFEKMKSPHFKLTSDALILFEDHFHWASNAVGLAQRLQVYQSKSAMLQDELHYIMRMRPNATRQTNFKINARMEKGGSNVWGKLDRKNVLAAFSIYVLAGLSYLEARNFFVDPARPPDFGTVVILSVMLSAILLMLSSLAWETVRDKSLVVYFPETVVRLNNAWINRSQESLLYRVLLNSWLPLALCGILLPIIYYAGMLVVIGFISIVALDSAPPFRNLLALSAVSAIAYLWILNILRKKWPALNIEDQIFFWLFIPFLCLLYALFYFS